MLGFIFILTLIFGSGFVLLLIFSLFRASSRADEAEEKILELISPAKSIDTKQKEKAEVLYQKPLASSHSSSLDR